MPGFVLGECVFKNEKTWIKIPAYVVLSTIVSVCCSYVNSLIFGFSRSTNLCCFVFFVFLLIVKLVKDKKPFFDFKENITTYIVGAVIFLIFFISLYPGLFKLYKGYFVMSGPNWQDTAMHFSIIQSISQGNFPPQAPYFSGHGLSYYYFSDFHAAIIGSFIGGFSPNYLVYLVSLFASIFFFSVFALVYEFTKDKLISVFAGIGSVFFGNLGFINLIKDFFAKDHNLINLIANSPYSLDNKYLLMVPMSDYLLQNRPMMIGLPVFTMVIFFILKNAKNRKEELVNTAVSGILTVSLIKFQLFGFVSAWIFASIFFLANIYTDKKLFYKKCINFLLFLIPSLISVCVLIFSKTG
ncbi:MAG: hypothetical protein GYA62_16625, partial [Bacteroidales bacterium]|nr:hypothetical protein [Bacteroidales bacterium]